MVKKPLIGVSICAVVLLVLGSLSNVVGYQSVKSSGLSESPLFITRTKRAIKQENNNILTSNYLGKGLETHLQFLMRDNNRTKLIQKAIHILNKMTDKELDQLQEIIISYNYENKIDKIAFERFIFFLSHLKSNNIDIRSYLINFNNTINNEPPTFTGYYSVEYQEGYLHCIIDWCLLYLIVIFLSIIGVFVSFFDFIHKILTYDN